MSGHLDYQLIKSVCNKIGGHFPITFTAGGATPDPGKITSGDIYVPLADDRYDGHRFIEAAIEAGAAATFWKLEVPLPQTVPQSFPVFYVDEPLEAVRKMAADYLLEVDPARIALTGDYSRIAAKKMLESVLAGTYNIHRTDRTDGNEQTVLETILSMPAETDAIICDVSPESQESVQRISSLLQPSFSLICHASRSEAAGSLKHAAAIESSMKASSSIIVDGDVPFFNNREWKADVITYGYGENCLFTVKKADSDDNGMCTFQVEGIMMDFQIPVLLSGHLKTVLSVIAVSLHLGLGADQLYKPLKHITSEKLLLDKKTTGYGSVILFDHGDLAETDLVYSLGMLKDLHTFEKRVLIVDEGFQAAPEDKTLHEVFASEVNPPVTDVISIGEKAFWVTEALKRRGSDKLNSRHFSEHSKAVETFKDLIESKSLILYRGANRPLLEQMTDELNSR